MQETHARVSTYVYTCYGLSMKCHPWEHGHWTTSRAVFFWNIVDTLGNEASMEEQSHWEQGILQCCYSLSLLFIHFSHLQMYSDHLLHASAVMCSPPWWA